nr:prepilin-type N-terminal cleavage/methylation domain-containing protein [Pseudomonadales bacterium]
MKGFSLVELMIALAIIGVISSIAYPSYQSYIQDTYHGQAQ